MAWLDKLHHPEYYVKTFLKWGVLGVITAEEFEAKKKQFLGL